MTREQMAGPRQAVLAAVDQLDAGEFCGLCRTLLFEAKIRYASPRWFHERDIMAALEAYIVAYEPAP